MKDVERYFDEIKQYKLLAKHEVGQNFLIDAKIAKSIVDSCDIGKDDRVLEIGSGAGSLSYFLALAGADTTLLDIDEGLIEKLKGDFQNIHSINPVVANAMKFDLSPYNKIVGNLPYYITSSLLERIVFDAPSMKLGVFMIQKEAFERVALPTTGKDNYGPLPIVLSLFFKVNKAFGVPRQCFAPSPHVDSIVFSLSPNGLYHRLNRKDFYKFLCGVFAHRRKTISNNLESVLGNKTDAKKALLQANIDSSLRPENITPEDLLSLYFFVAGETKV